MPSFAFLLNIIIIIFLHGLGRLTCSGIDALPSFLGASTVSSSSRFVVEGVFRVSSVVHSFKVVEPVLFVFESHVLYSRVQGCASLLMNTLFSLRRLPTHPQNPHSLRTSLSLLVWPPSYGLSGLGCPTRNMKVPAGVARRAIEARKPPPPTRQGGDNGVDIIINVLIIKCLLITNVAIYSNMEREISSLPEIKYHT